MGASRQYIEELAMSYPTELGDAIISGRNVARALYAIAAHNGTRPPTKDQVKYEATQDARDSLLYADGKAIEPAPSKAQLRAAYHGAIIGVQEVFAEGVWT